MTVLTSAMDTLREGVATIRGQRSGKRMLVHEIMSIQILSAALVGLLAIAALYWGGQWILKNNYSRWALQWTEELNELGSPLYLEDDQESLIRLERFVESYAEIDRVAYYDRNGNSLFAVSNDTNDTSDKPLVGLSDEQLADATSVVGQVKPYVLEGNAIDPRRFEILAPVWVEALDQDGLFDFDPGAVDAATSTELVGFVAIHLDFILFHDRLLANIRIAILALLVLLIGFALYGRHVLQRALRSISELEQPIRELAKGNLAVRFEPAPHREISDIVDALKTTASSLSERNAKLVKLANHDSLTGLYNRRRFIEELSANLVDIVRNGGNSALFFIDLDQFKYVNDLCGHPAGDRLIRKVADELSRSVPDRATIARFGGDEFVVLLPNADHAKARKAADDITRRMRRVAHIENEHVFHIHCSIGVTIA
ncbi:MAG: sensor domain-containing diguanylate cyclase, partial [Pseudomonadota bacterium]